MALGVEGVFAPCRRDHVLEFQCLSVDVIDCIQIMSRAPTRNLWKYLMASVIDGDISFLEFVVQSRWLAKLLPSDHTEALLDGMRY